MKKIILQTTIIILALFLIYAYSYFWNRLMFKIKYPGEPYKTIHIDDLIQLEKDILKNE